MSLHGPSRRSHEIAEHFGSFMTAMGRTTWGVDRKAADACDFFTGDPQEDPIPGYVDTLRAFAIPESRDWFGYNRTVPGAWEAAAKGLSEHTGVPFDADGITMTNGGFGALVTAIKILTDPGDEAIIVLPPYHSYEPMSFDAGLTVAKVSIDRETFDLDVDAIAAAINKRTRVVFLNTPHNPTGKIYPPQTLKRLADVLEEASERNGRRIYIISDEVLNRIIYDGARFHTPAEFYPYTFLCYSYGKTLLAPGERIGYIAMPSAMPDRDRMGADFFAVQTASGYLIPNTVLQRALPELEKMSVDVGRLQAKRDRMVGALRDMGYDVLTPEASFYLTPKSPPG